MFIRQVRRTYIDWFIAVAVRMTKSGRKTEINLIDNDFYKDDWKEPDWLIGIT